MDSRMVDNRYRIEYVRVAKKIAKYYKLDCCEPKELSQEYKSVLDDYRFYLDSIGIKMPLPKYYFDSKDKRTWKYKEVIIGLEDNKPIYKRSVLNEDWEGHKK